MATKKLALLGIGGKVLTYSLDYRLRYGLSLLDSMYSELSCDKFEEDIVLIEGLYSAKIEGARTTVDAVKSSALKSKHTKSEQMVLNTISASKVANLEGITSSNIRNIWEILTSGVCENTHCDGVKYRRKMVYISDDYGSISHTPQSVDLLDASMESLFSYLDSSSDSVIVKAIVLHFYFVYIHPFCDGNGRLARLWLSSFLIRNGYDKFRFLSVSRQIAFHTSRYYNSIQSSEVSLKDGTLYLNDFIEFVLLELLSSIEWGKKFNSIRLNKNEIAILGIMKKKGSCAEITVKRCASILDVSYSVALGVLNSLTEKEFLIKIRQDKNYYRLSKSSLDSFTITK